MLSIKTGSYPISNLDIFYLLSGQKTIELVNNVFYGIRLPRLVAAIVAGAGLSIAGVVMQSLLRNPLASPFTLGISHGAVFGASFAIIVLGAGQLFSTGNEAVLLKQGSNYIVVISAFLGALLAVSLVMLLSLVKAAKPESLILGGVALNAFFVSATMLLQYFATDMQVAAIVSCTFGDLGKARWNDIWIISTVLIISFLYFFYNSWNYNAMEWGDEAAKGLGSNVRILIPLGMFFSCMNTAVITSFVGIIGFIGLIAPHIARSLVGNNHRYLIPCSVLVGASLLTLCDILSRTIISSIIIPVGLISSFTGAPFFFYLLLRGSKKR
jgi:iron complex transport system permease protein